MPFLQNIGIWICHSDLLSSDFLCRPPHSGALNNEQPLWQCLTLQSTQKNFKVIYQIQLDWTCCRVKHAVQQLLWLSCADNEHHWLSQSLICVRTLAIVMSQRHTHHTKQDWKTNCYWCNLDCTVKSICLLPHITHFLTNCLLPFPKVTCVNLKEIIVVCQKFL